MRSKKAYIYALSDPFTDEIRYIGKTTNTKKRLNKHINNAKRKTKPHRLAWINSLLKRNTHPKIEVIDEVNVNEWEFWETYWIHQFKTWGLNLLNETDGGEGIYEGHVPWNKGTVGVMKANEGTIKKGQRNSPETEIKKGERKNPKTEFKKNHKPYNTKIVDKFDLNGDYIETYYGLKDAAKSANIHHCSIQRCIKKGTFKSGGYLWKIRNNNK